MSILLKSVPSIKALITVTTNSARRIQSLYYAVAATRSSKH